MRALLGTACAWLLLGLPAGAQQPPVARGRVALADLVPAGDPLGAHDLGFDASFAAGALAQLRAPDPALAARLAASPAVAHLLAHARNFDYDVPKDSGVELVDTLLAPAEKLAERTETCRQSLAYFSGPLLADPRWVADALRYLPADFRFHGTLFLTFGYDIGVAYAANASLNCAHPHFAGHQSEILYYAIHELHHVGFMSYQPPPRLADLKTCGDLLRLVDYSTELEGMAVLAALQRRRDEGALAGDRDYAALADEARMLSDAAAWAADRELLARRGDAPADGDAWKVIDRMSSGERLWYRVGAWMAQRIEAAHGRDALVALVREGPAAFQAACRSLPPPPAAPATR